MASRLPEGRAKARLPNVAGKVESHANIVHRGFYSLQCAAGIVAPATDKKREPIMVPATDENGDPVSSPDGKPVLRQAMWPKDGLHALGHFFASWVAAASLSRVDCHRSIRVKPQPLLR